jgi:hypothetical protein
MEHFFHVFIPGTPENMALVQTVPAFTPMLNQFTNLFTNLFSRWQARGKPMSLAQEAARLAEKAAKAESRGDQCKADRLYHQAALKLVVARKQAKGH